MQGIELKVARTRARLTQREVARRLGCSRTTLWLRYEAPDRVEPALTAAYFDALDEEGSWTRAASTGTTTTGATPSTSGSAGAADTSGTAD